MLGFDAWDDDTALTSLAKIVVNPDRTLTIHTTRTETPVTVNLDERSTQ